MTGTVSNRMLKKKKTLISKSKNHKQNIRPHQYNFLYAGQDNEK